MPVALPPERDRLARVLVALRPHRVSNYLQGLDEDKVRSILTDMASIPPMSADEARAVLVDFTRELLARGATAGGSDYASRVLEKLYGAERAGMIAAEIASPFHWLSDFDLKDLGKALNREPPAPVALALAHTDSATSAKLLRYIEEPKRSDVAMRMASLISVAPDVVESVDRSLRERITADLAGVQHVEGVSILVEVLTQSSPRLQENIVESIRKRDHKLAEQIKERLFVFEDIVMLENAAIQELLKAIDTKDLVYALKSTTGEIIDLITRNMSERAREGLKEEMDYIQNPKPAEIKAARTRIVAAIRMLEESGVIEILRPGQITDDDEDEDDEDFL